MASITNALYYLNQFFCEGLLLYVRGRTFEEAGNIVCITYKGVLHVAIYVFVKAIEVFYNSWLWKETLVRTQRIIVEVLQ